MTEKIVIWSQRSRKNCIILSAVIYAYV